MSMSSPHLGVTSASTKKYSEARASESINRVCSRNGELKGPNGAMGALFRTRVGHATSEFRPTGREGFIYLRASVCDEITLHQAIFRFRETYLA